jgi:hypothetical protein
MLGLLLLPFLAAGAAAPAGAESDPYRHGVGSPYYGGSPYGGYGYGGGPYYGGYDPGDYGRAYYGQGYGWGGDGLPGGDWRYSCRDIVVRGDKLYAECRDFGGGWERTGITYTLCRGGMVNRRGSLECAGGGYYHGASQGDYDEVAGPGRLHPHRPLPRLERQLSADRHRSARLRARRHQESRRRARLPRTVRRLVSRTADPHKGDRCAGGRPGNPPRAGRLALALCEPVHRRSRPAC